MAEGIPLQVQCRCRPQYEEEEREECRGLQLLAEGYPFFHQCLCQSYCTGESPLQEYKCQCGRHVHFEDEHRPQNQCGCRRPSAEEGYPWQDQCRCRQLPVRKGHPPQDQCRGGRSLPFGCGHPPQDQCRGRQPPAVEGYPPQDQCRCRQVPIQNGHHLQDQCRGGQLPDGQGQRPQGQCHGQKLPVRKQEQPNGEEQTKEDQNGGGKQDGEDHSRGDQDPDSQKPDPRHPSKLPYKCTEEKTMKNGSSSPARSICTCISIFLLLAGATILVLWLIYRPHKPRFKVIGVAIYDLNTTFPPFMSTTMQFTIIIKNPNKRVSIYYDKLSAFVSYKNQAITTEAMMPPLHMKKRSTVEVAPVIGGTPVQVSMEVANGLAIDEIYGVMGLKLVFMGRLRWKVGAIKTKHYGIYVDCDLMLDLKKGCVGPVPLLGSPICSVDI